MNLRAPARRLVRTCRCRLCEVRGVGDMALDRECNPRILNRKGHNGGDRVHSLNDPMPAATGRSVVCKADIATKRFIHANRTSIRPRAWRNPHRCKNG